MSWQQNVNSKTTMHKNVQKKKHAKITDSQQKHVFGHKSII